MSFCAHADLSSNTAGTRSAAEIWGSASWYAQRLTAGIFWGQTSAEASCTPDLRHGFHLSTSISQWVFFFHTEATLEQHSSILSAMLAHIPESSSVGALLRATHYCPSRIAQWTRASPLQRVSDLPKTTKSPPHSAPPLLA
jgi:hypothetical protein